MKFKTTVSADLINEYRKTVSYDNVLSELTKFDMVDWINFPFRFSIDSFLSKADKIDTSVDYILSLGVGGSFHGLEAICHFFGKENSWLFAGASFDSQDILSTKEKIKGKKIGVNIISKSGDTLEVKLMLDLFAQEMKQAVFINVITSSIDFFSMIKNYYFDKTCFHFAIEEGTGGRFSIIGEMGLLGLYLCHQDINEFMGTLQEELFKWKNNEESSPIVLRGVSRFILQKESGIKLEGLSTNEKQIFVLLNWIRQLMAESDGKNGKGLYCCKLFYPQDAHSVGQILKEGPPVISETFYTIKNHLKEDIISEKNDLSNVKVKSINQINTLFIEAIKEDRKDSGMIISEYILESHTVKEFARLLISEMGAICIESFLLKLNPFDQPGVESYKEKVKKKLFFN